MKAVVLLLSVAVAALAKPDGGYNGQGSGGQGPGPTAPAQYSFQWDVNDQPSGNFYGHQEERNNDDTRGSYYVQLPDSRRLVVEYFVDQWGYHPTVTYEGEAQFPTGTNGQGGGNGGGGGGGFYQ